MCLSKGTLPVDVGVVTVADKLDIDVAKEAYVNWKLTPKQFRTPDTKVELAKQLGVHRKTLDSWDKQQWLIDAIRNSKDALAAGWWADIMSRLMETVENGSPNESTQAARVLLSHLDFKTEKEEKATIDESALEKILKDAGITFVKE